MTEITPKDLAKLDKISDNLQQVSVEMAELKAVVQHQSEKNTVSIAYHSQRLTEQDARLNGLEKLASTYDGSIKALNRLLTLTGALMVSGIVWLVSNTYDLKNSQKSIEERYNILEKELNELENRLDKKSEDLRRLEMELKSK